MDFGFIEFCLGISIIILVSAYAKSRFPRHSAGRQPQPLPQPAPERAKPNPAALKALAAYERLAKEKMDVMKTALAMGYHDDDLARLDARLESLIGREKLEQIVAGAAMLPSSDMLDTNLDSEIRRLQRLRQG